MLSFVGWTKNIFMFFFVFFLEEKVFGTSQSAEKSK